MSGISDLGRLFSTAQRLSDKIENFEKVKVRNDLEISAITELATEKKIGEFQIKKKQWKEIMAHGAKFTGENKIEKRGGKNKLKRRK